MKNLYVMIKDDGKDKFLEWAKLTAQLLVDKPEAVEVKFIEGGQTTVLEKKVDGTDLGKIIGIKGRNANSIRTLINAMAAKEGHRILVELLDPKNERKNA